ncbi:MAG: dienelactone hydrolase family protein, partial [Gammaproteobacteria bacterium]
MWSRIALAAALVIGAASSAVAFTPDWVRFSSKVAGPTPLRARLAELNGVETAPPTGTSIYGELFRPAGDGTFPAVILLHGCLGFEQYHRNWAQLLAGWGYVTLLVDSFEPRGLKQFCERTDLRAYAKTGGRMDDAFGALEYLSGQSFVDADRVGVMGWNYTALTAVAEHGARFYANRFRAAVALYPECGFTSSGQ